MKIAVIRVNGMGVERLEVLRLLERNSAENLVSEVSEHVVDEGVFAGSDFLTGLAARMGEMQVVFIAVPGVYASLLATASLRLGLHTFLGRSAVPSIVECKALAALGEEAGVEIGLSRITRFHPFLQALPDLWRPAAITVHHDTGMDDKVDFQQMIEDAADLCCSLAGTGEVRKIEAQLVQNEHIHPASLIAGFRFKNGTYAQIQLRQGVSMPWHAVYAGGGSFEFEANLNNCTLLVRNSPPQENHPIKENEPHRFAFESKTLPNENLIELETKAFLQALTTHKPVPMSILDGLQTLKLVEGVRGYLR